jgi:hypothetical protein
MSLHDAYARFTPFELLFSEVSDAESLAVAVQEEAEGRGADVDQPHAFVTMGAVTDFIRRIQGEHAPPEAIHQYGALAFHALHFHRAGHPLYLLTTHAARFLVEGAGGADPRPPAPAGYLQLPQHLFWLDDGSGTPQSVDGIFWRATPSRSLHALLVTGLRADGSGAGVVPLPEAPLGDAASWLDLDARGDGSDFSNPMPGAELDALYLFATSGEVFKLLARFFAYTAAVPGALDAGGAPSEGGAGEGAGAPEISALPFVRVTLEG